MKRLILILMTMLLVAGMSLLLVACTDKEIPEPEEKVLDNFDQGLANSSNEFGFELLRELMQEEGEEENLFISPTSIYTALAMTYNGARGETREAMAEVLGVEGVELERFNQNNLARLYKLQEADPEVTLNLVNSLWMSDYYQFNPDFVSRNEEYYHALCQEMDFSAPETTDIINGWVEYHTGGHIEEIIGDSIDPMSLLFLINAVYFQGDWSEPFDVEDTEEDVFYGPEGEIEDVPFMHRSDDFSYLEKEEKFQAVRLPYGEEERLAMYVFLPHEESSLSCLVSEMDAETWDGWREEFSSMKMEGDLFLPRFEMEYEKTLNDILEDMGLEIAFGSNANFYDMVVEPKPEGAIFIDEVRHKSFIEVDEEGTEAAAATKVKMGVESVLDHFHMEVNRPFFFLIHDEEINEVIFTGTVSDPL